MGEDGCEMNSIHINEWGECASYYPMPKGEPVAEPEGTGPTGTGEEE